MCRHPNSQGAKFEIQKVFSFEKRIMTGPITSKHIFWLFLNYVIDNFVFETFLFADCERRVKTYLGFCGNFFIC